MAERMTPEREAHIRRSAAFDPARFRLERELLSELDAVRRENAALQEQSEAATQGLEVLRCERDEARQTAQRLNRRTQEAEAALADLRKCVEAVNGGKPWCGGSLGRAFLAWDNQRLRDAVDCVCYLLTDSILASGNDAQTNMALVRKLRDLISSAPSAALREPDAPLRAPSCPSPLGGDPEEALHPP